jgi:nucleoside-diphosphate-sugar epimerase
MAVLVTGSTGAVGSHVMLYLQMRKMDHFAYDLRSVDEPGETTHVLHIAGVNRGDNLYVRNLRLAKRLTEVLSPDIQTLTYANSVKAKTDDSDYAKGKREAGEYLQQWCKERGILFRNCYLPNLLGPFGRPNHNMVATTIAYHLVTGRAMPPLSTDAFEVGTLFDAAVELCKFTTKPRQIRTYTVSAQFLETRIKQMMEGLAPTTALDHAILEMVQEMKDRQNA